jgi:hypothetical protein
MKPRLLCWLLLGLWLAPVPSPGSVVINEIFYHAPDDLDDLEWIELHNPHERPVDVAGWRLTQGVEFQFPAGTSIPAGGYLVLARDARLFAEFYPVPVAGEFKKSLGNGGDTLVLSDASGNPVDRVSFEDSSPWPVAADGESASLERITPNAPGERPENWMASMLSDEAVIPAGSPGARNSAYSATLPPIIRGVALSPEQLRPGDPLRVVATVEGAGGREVERVELRYRIAKPGVLDEERIVAMQRDDQGRFSAEIPGQAANQLLRFRIRAVGPHESVRLFPAENELRPAISVFVAAPPEAAKIPVAYLIHPDAGDHAEGDRLRRRALSTSEGPFGNREAMRAVQALESALDLRVPWFEWTVNRPLPYETYRVLRQVFAERDTGRRAIREAIVAGEDPAAAARAEEGRMREWQEALGRTVREALGSEASEAWDRWHRERLVPKPPEPADFLGQLLDIESLWLALNLRFELTEPAYRSIQEVLRSSASARAEQLPLLMKLMRGEGDFAEMQSALGKVEAEMEKELQPLLSLRQRRFLEQVERDRGSPIRPRSAPPRPVPSRGRSAFVHVNPKTAMADVYDFVSVTERSAGFKVRFQKDRPFHDMTTASVIFEYNDRFVLAEPLAFELYRRAGSPACRTEFARLVIDGQPAGYHLIFEQVNKAFLRRNGIDPDGDLYKIAWYGRGIEGQHQRQNHPERGHAELVRLVERLNETDGQAQWEVIQSHFNVDQVINYFAVNMCLSHWDGFFNNYFTYHDRKGTGKWLMYPWDQDKTWGFHDATHAHEPFFDMPISFGMKGDTPPGGGPPVFRPGSWWRPPGFFSGPLLANPEFRNRFLRRTHQILEELYTEEMFFPIIDAMAAELREEIPFRAGLVGEPPEAAMARFNGNIGSLKQHLVKRREFLLNTPELKQLAANP